MSKFIRIEENFAYKLFSELRDAKKWAIKNLLCDIESSDYPLNKSILLNRVNMKTERSVVMGRIIISCSYMATTEVNHNGLYLTFVVDEKDNELIKWCDTIIDFDKIVFYL